MRTKTKLVRSVLAVARHRNGVGGRPFHAVAFHTSGSQELMLGVVFDEPGTVAVFDVSKLAAGIIEFGENSYRGDQFEPGLRAVINGPWRPAASEELSHHREARLKAEEQDRMNARAQQVECQSCGAQPVEMCTDTNSKQRAPHRTRINKAARLAQQGRL